MKWSLCFSLKLKIADRCRIWRIHHFVIGEVQSQNHSFGLMKFLPTRDCKTKISSVQNCDSAIGQNDECAKFYNDQQFSILAKARTPFHFAAFKTTNITIHQPVLCRHKEFAYALQIPH